jgi:hypothetical protein
VWIWRFGTPDKVGFDRLNKKYPGEIVFAPQTAHAINPVEDVSTSRWGSGVVKRVEENILQVGVLLKTGGNKADGMIENVSFESVILASTECPSKVAAGIDAVEHALKRIAELCQ